MKKLLGAALAAVLFGAPAWALNAPDTALVTGPNFQQVPAAQIIITVPGGSQTTLGAALAASGGCTTNCTFGGITAFSGAVGFGANAVSGSNFGITGGSIDGVTIGGATPAVGHFTNLSATGTVAFPSSATITSGNFNATGASAFEVNGNSVINLSNATLNPSLFFGPFSGASAPAGSQFFTAVGVSALESVNTASAETTGVGGGAGMSLTTGGGTMIGLGDCMSQTVTGCDSYGTDAMRDTWEPGTQGGSTVFGNGSYADGLGNNPNVVFGSQTLLGNMGTITVTGTPGGAGSTYTLTPSTSNLCNGTTLTVNCTTGSMAPIAYATTSGDTTATLLASHLSTAFSGFTPSQVNYTLGDGAPWNTRSVAGIAWQIADANHPTVIKGHFPGNWMLSWTITCAGTCGATTTYAVPFSGGNNALVGQKIFGYFGATTASNNSIVGNQSVLDQGTSANALSMIGFSNAPICATCSFNAVVGENSLTLCVSCSRNIVMSGNNGGASVTGNGNTILSDETITGSTCISSGNNNLELGEGACVKTPTASNQGSIINAIYLQNASGSGSTVSPAQFGFDIVTPTATLTVSDAGGTTTTGTHVSFVQTAAPTITTGTATLDAQASDVSGTVTEGTTQTGFALTFTKAFATAPHCMVSAPATGVTATTTIMTVTNASATGDVISYACFQ